jgi:UDP:flavonoid glycosyltransferase YjiC (YdhE family)
LPGSPLKKPRTTAEKRLGRDGIFSCGNLLRENKNTNPVRQPKRILVAPLNWGLGHATRCIPIIWELQNLGAEVFLASDGRALQLLKKEFPDLPALELPGYGVQYDSKNMTLNMGRETPKILRAIFGENKKTQKFIEKYQLDGVISDNRLGCFSKNVPTVFLTHQINLIVPGKTLQWFSRRLNYFFIKKYDECWVPDIGEEPNLSGLLSHNTPLHHKVKFIGALSRMRHFEREKKQDIIAVLSGPEPQRTKLEKAFINQAKKLPYRCLVVQGKPEENSHFFIGKNIEVVAYLTSDNLNKAILGSDVYVGRSGYSSVMDLAKLGKPALFIPTPGQTEQEYLAEQFAKSHIFHSQKQEEFDLKNGVEIAMQKGRLAPQFFTDKKMKQVIRNFLYG